MKIRDGAIPTGKGIFVHYLSRCAGGDMELFVDCLVKWKFGFANIKVTNGISLFKGSIYERYQQQKLLDILVPLLKAAGIQVHFWGYTFGKKPGRETLPIIEMIQKHRPLSYTVNAEREYKKDGMATAAETHMSLIHHSMSISSGDDIPDIPIGLTSYRWPSVQPEFPWKAFIDYIDFHMPQVYWQKANNPAEQLRRSVEELHRLRAVPIIPAGTCYPEGSWKPTPSHLDEFNEEAKNLGLPGVLYWEWYYAVKYDLIQTLAKHEWGDVPPPPPEEEPTADEKEKLWHNRGVDEAREKAKGAYKA